MTELQQLAAFEAYFEKLKSLLDNKTIFAVSQAIDRKREQLKNPNKSQRTLL